MGQDMKLPMKLPDGTYGVPDPDSPSTMTLWWVRNGKMSAWPKGVRYAPFPPKPPADLKGQARGEWRTAWYDRVYWPWKARVIDAIADGLELARRRFDEHVPEDERPVIPGGKKAKADRVRAQQIEAAFMYEVRKLSLDEIVQRTGLPKTTAWRRIEEGRVLLARIEELTERINRAEVSAFALAAGRFESDATASQSLAVAAEAAAAGERANPQDVPTAGGAR